MGAPRGGIDSPGGLCDTLPSLVLERVVCPAPTLLFVYADGGSQVDHSPP